MPGTPEEQVALARLVVQGILAPDFIEGQQWADGTRCTEAESMTVVRIARFEHARLETEKPEVRQAQRRAMRLLRRYLTPTQQLQLRRSRYFDVETPAGRRFRLRPHRGAIGQVERHGSRYYEINHYCIHPDQTVERLPPADLTLAHLLLLSADEEAFLAEANVARRFDQLWNGEHLRRLRAARLRRAAEAQERAA